jgi:hypothetical protein
MTGTATMTSGTLLTLPIRGSDTTGWSVRITRWK